ncbi:hypothetical protein MAM1_0255c08791 [Mucor ambiguus]|uniref:Uncharacterized protein n=1 Tax=Mucor ambiguus TaxID=91626 RepID=A0A0C9MF49_9FUNG|nr:hypothetical protein MAM1_0255c08791 [Mucor ambiguus]
MTTTINSDVSTQDWVKKFHFENKVDLNLQTAVDNESTKIEVDEIPAMMNNNTTAMNNSSDSYLQSILSSSASPSQAAANNSSTACTGSQTCACYKCQRQRRRAGVSRTATPPTVMKSKASPDVYTPLKKIENTSNANNLSNRSTEAKPSSSSTFSSSPSPTAMTPPTITTIVSPPTPSPSPSPAVSIKAPTPTSPVSPKQQQQTQKPKRSSTLRKTPTLKSYERHMPRPAYAQQDSIYRIEQDDLEKREETNRKTTTSTTNELLEKAAQDNYQISWKDEGTGDDLLTSLVTFQTIFEEKAVNENEGLSDLLEQRTKELQSQKLMQHHITKEEDEELPPRLSDCLTMSHRNGPRHNPLTLYHTMKMNGEKERMNAYNIAFQHCIHANSGMRAWIKRSRVAPTRENSKLVQSATAGRRPTIKRSLLHPLASRKNKVAGDELLVYSASSENLSIRSATSKKSIEMISAPILLIQPQQDDQITDIISTAHALLPNRQFSTNTTTQQNKVPYEHIDTPSRPRQNTTVTTTLTSTSLSEFKDSSSISSSESANGGSQTSSKLKKSRPGRLFSSLGRKTSMRSHSINSNKASSIRSLEKIDSGNESTLSQEKVVLDDLCRILPHLERSQLLPYVQEANCDYMKALQLCKSAVISGKLT